ncbi:MAG: L-histidine N(alpha)-methyltransferase [Pedosphaera parvula]|nr:L-histidine N(alpha)-methyltransferase [Pedosphaera parvula]
MRSIRPQYDNPLTRDWLMAFLLDVGIEPGDGHISCSIEEDPVAAGVHRIVADFVFSKSRSVTVGHERFDFAISDRIRLFFSYRYAPRQIQMLLERHGLEVRQEWIADSNEEGVFLCGCG